MKKLHTTSLRIFGFKGMLLSAVMIWLSFSSLTCLAQETQRGTASHGSFALSDIETINQTNGNLMFHFPLASLPAGRKGMSAGVGLYYNSKLYDSYTDNACGFDPNSGQWDCALTQQVYQSPQGGWRYGIQYKLQQAWSGYNCVEPSCTAIIKMQMSFPDGSTHEFAPYGYPGTGGYYRIQPDGYGYDQYGTWTLITTGTMTYYSTDGSYLRLDVQHDANDGWENNPWTLSLPDGGKVKFNEPGTSGLRIYDSNSNYVEVQNIILPNGNPANKVIDQFNRSIIVEHAYAYPTSTTYVRSQGANGQTLTWTIPEINNLGFVEYNSDGANGQRYLLQAYPGSGVDQIISPSQAGGYAYKFDYTDPYSSGYFEVKSVTLPNAEQNKAKAIYAYVPPITYYPYITDILEHKLTQKTLKYLKQYDNPTTYDDPANYVTETWTYACSCTFGGGTSTTTSPNGSVATSWAHQNLLVGTAWKVGLVYKSESADGTIIERLWKPNTPQGHGEDINPYIKTEFVSLKDAGGTLVKTAITDYNYDKNGNLTQRADYDFVDYATVPRDGTGKPTGIPAGAVPKSVIANTYSYPTPDASDKTTVTSNAYNRPGSPNVRAAGASTEVRSGFSPTTALTRSEFFYDNVATTANKVQVQTWDSVKGGISRPLTTTNSTSIYTAYDTYGNVAIVTDTRSVQTKFEYNPIVIGDTTTANLYITNIRKAFGTPIQLNTSLTYDFISGLALTATDDDNNVTNKTTYDDLGRPTLSQEVYSSATNIALRQVTSQYLDASRTVITRSDLTTVGDGKTVAIQHHDQLGRLRLARALENPATESATDETTGIKVQTRFAYTSTNTYKVVSNSYRAATATAASSEPTMGWARETVDRSGRVVESQTFDGSGLPAPWETNTNSMGISTIAYDANYTTTTDPAGKIKRTLRNGLGQLVRTDEPNNANSLGAQDTPAQATTYTYDTLGRMTLVTQGVQTRSFSYSSLSRLLSATNPEKNGPDTYEYDANGNVTKHTDARAWYATSTYDELNRVKTIDYSNTTVNPDVKKFYDNPTAGKYGKGRYWYDYAGGDNTTGQTVEQSAVDAYDVFGRALSMRQQFKTAGVWSAAFTTSHLYDLAGNVKEKTLPSTRKITYSFDAIGRLSQMVGNIGDGTQRTYTTGIVYNSTGSMIREQFGTQTPLYHNRHFNNLGQLYDVRLGTNGGDEWSWNRGALRIFNGANWAVGNGGTYNNGNVYREDHFVPLNEAASAWFMSVDYYGYDELNRVTGIWEQTYDSTGSYNPSALNQTYSYDRYGNRAVSGTAGSPISPAFKFVAATNRQKAPTDTDTDATTDKLRYDAVGNLIKDTHTQSGAGTRTYDINNQMVTAVGTNGLLDTYGYDAAGHRVRRSINNGATNWWQVYGIGGELVAEYAAGANPNSPGKEYAYRLGELLVVGDVGACTTRWLVTDQVGTPRILADATGSLAGVSRHDYLPFGEELYAGYGGRTTAQGYTGDCVRDKFANYERDAETGLDYAEARYHGSVYGRFTSVDPAMGSARKSLPQSWNRYSYVMNRPLSLIDPTGEYWVSLVSNGGNLHRVPGSNAQATADEKKAWLAQGYQTFDDNSETDTKGGGTGRFAQFNYSHVRLGADGELHFATKIGAGEIMTAGIVAAVVLPVAGLAIAPVVLPEVALGTAAGYAASGIAVLGTPQGMAAVAVVAGLGGATAVDVLTDPAPSDEEDKENRGYYVRFGDGPETLESLTNDANKTVGTKFPYGVSVMFKERISGSDKNNRYAPVSEAEAAFKIEQTGNNPRHNTVNLPNPITPEVVERFNSVFRKR